MDIKLKNVRAGSIVMVRGEFGNGSPVEAVAISVDKNIKNGMPGIDYRPVNNQYITKWAYLSQIDKVIKF